jgi:hypothetical protein
MCTSSLIPMHQLVDQLIIDLLPLTTRQRSLIINDVSHTATVTADGQLLSSVLGQLLHSTVQSTQNNCIRLSTRSLGSLTQVHIHNTDLQFKESIMYNMQQMEDMADLFGGCISFTTNNVSGSTLAFTFRNALQAA